MTAEERAIIEWLNRENIRVVTEHARKMAAFLEHGSKPVPRNADGSFTIPIRTNRRETK